MRRLPFVNEPLEGESLSGFMLRLCELYGFQPGDVSEAIGFHPREEKVRSRRSGYRLTENQKKRITMSTGIPAERLVRMTLEHFNGRLFHADLNSKRVRGIPQALGRRVSVWDTAYCPECLAENRTMFLSWQSRWSFVCTKHKKALIVDCPKCGREVSVLKRQRWPKDPNGEVTDVTWCWWARGGEVCRGRLAEAPAVDESRDEELIAAQKVIDQITEGEIEPTIASEEVGPPDFFCDIYGLTYLVRLRRDVESGLFDRGDIKSPGSTGRAEQLWSRETRRPYVAGAMRLAALKSIDELTDWIRETGNLAYKEANVRLPQHRVFPGHSDVFGTALEFARQTVCYSDPVTRHGLSKTRVRRPAGLSSSIETRHVPQLFWRDDFESEIEVLLEEVDLTRWRARRLCSVLLVRMIKPLDWVEAAEELGFDVSDPSHRALWVAFSEVAKHDKDWQLINAIREIANRRAETGDLVDYRERQAQLSEWEGIDNLTYIYLNDNYKPIRYHHDHPRKRAFISSMIWSDLVQADETSSQFWQPDWDRYDLTKFQQDFLPRYETRIKMLQEIVRLNPQSSTTLQLGMLISDLVETDQISPGFRSHELDPELIDRTLRHVSAHTGVDVASITRRHRRNNRPPAEVYSRLLAGHILYRLGGSFWDEVASALGAASGTRCNRDNQAFLANLKRMKRMDAARHHLVRSVRDGRGGPPLPSGPEPHHERMVRLAKQIKKSALATSSGYAVEEKEAILLSQLACKTHTDLSDRDIGDVHDGNMGFRFVPWARGTQPVPDHLAEAHASVSRQAFELQVNAGYGATYLKRGLASIPEDWNSPVPSDSLIVSV